MNFHLFLTILLLVSVKLGAGNNGAEKDEEDTDQKNGNQEVGNDKEEGEILDPEAAKRDVELAIRQEQMVRRLSLGNMQINMEGKNLEDGTVEFLNQCHKDVYYTWSNIHRPWAKQMLDAFAKPGSSILDGNAFWFGDYDECVAVTAPKHSLSPNGFKGQYCWLAWAYTGEWTESYKMFSTGGCIPDSCSNEDFLNLYPTILGSVGGAYPALTQMGEKVFLTAVKTVPPMKPFPASAILFFLVIALLFLLVILGTCLDWDFGSEAQKIVEKEKVEEELPRYNFRTGILKIPWKRRVPTGGLSNFLSCFSLYKNFQTIFDTTLLPGQMACLHGIRFFSMLWVIAEHVFINIITITENISRGIDLMDTRPNQLIIEGQFSVDTFFLLSGFLLTLVFLKKTETIQMTFFKWIYFYVHRILRISPPFFIVLFFCTSVLPSLGDGPYWPYLDMVVGKCKDYWWTHVLYISNLFSANEECIPWTWYLPNDMQFYCISPVLLMLLKRAPRKGLLAIFSIMGFCMLITWFLGYEHEFAVTMTYLRIMKTNSESAQKSIRDVSEVMYTKPYSRIGPYLVGMLLAYYMHRMGNRRVAIRKDRLFCYWVLAICSGLFIIFGLYKWDVGRLGYSLYHATSRHIWAAAVSWVIYACATGNGGPVNSFLSWKGFFPLSRLSFCAYLVHPIFIYWMYYSTKQTIVANLFFTVTIYFGFVALGYLAAFVLCVLVEAPAARLEKLLTEPSDRSS